MKTLFKALIFFCPLFISSIALGQHTYMTLGANLVIPTASGLKMNAGTGFGGALGVEIRFGKRINGIATLQYLNFAEVETIDRTSNFKAIPIQVGIKYFVTSRLYEATGLFFSGEAGLMPTTLKLKYRNGIPEEKHKETGFTVAPGIGYQIERAEIAIRPLFNLTVSGFDIYYIDFRIAYRFF